MPGSHVAPKESLKASKREIGLKIDFLKRGVEDSYVNRFWVYTSKEEQRKNTNELETKICKVMFGS